MRTKVTKSFSIMLWLLLFGSLTAQRAEAQESLVSIPDQYPFEMYHRRLLPELPNILSDGVQAFDTTFSWSNTYNVKSNGYFVDAETRELTLKYSRGLSDSVTMVANVGVRMIDGGFTDSFIQTWDESIGATITHRDRRGKNRFQIEAQTKDGSTISIEKEPFGLTDLQVGLRAALLGDRNSDSKLVFGSDVTLPSHLGTYGQDSVDLRLSLLGSERIERFNFFINLGAALYGDQQEDDIEFDSGSLDAVLGLILNISQSWSVQIDQFIETSAQKNIKRYPDWTSYLDLALLYQIDSKWLVSFGVRENPINGQETTDVTGLLGLKYCWGP